MIEFKIPGEVILEIKLTQEELALFSAFYTGVFIEPIRTSQLQSFLKLSRKETYKIAKNLKKLKLIEITSKKSRTGVKINSYRLSRKYKRIKRIHEELSDDAEGGERERKNGKRETFSLSLSNTPEGGYIRARDRALIRERPHVTKIARARRRTSQNTKLTPLRGVNITRTRERSRVKKRSQRAMEKARRVILDNYAAKAGNTEKLEAVKARKKRREKDFDRFEITAPEYDKAAKLVAVYELKHREYHGLNSFVKVLKKPFGPRHPALKAVIKAVEIATELKMPFRQYVEAQFYWFHRWHERFPYLSQLGTSKGKYSAKARAEKYLETRLDFEDPLERVRKAKYEEKPLHTKKQRIEAGQKLLDELMDLHNMTEEEAILFFGQPYMGVLDLAFLEKNKTFKRLKREGQIEDV